MIAKYHKFQCVEVSEPCFEVQDGLFAKNLFIIKDVYLSTKGCFCYGLLGLWWKNHGLVLTGVAENDIDRVVEDKSGVLKRLLIAYTAKRTPNVAPKQRKLTYRTIRKR